jgi:hypothetical protein
MGTDYRRNLPNNAYQAATTANGPSSVNPYATINDLPTGVSAGNQLISGGASYSGTGLVFDVTFLEYRIAGVEYTANPTQVTLAVADPTFGRFDAIVVDENSVVSVLTGTPAAEPLTPAIGEDQVLVQYVALGPGATSPDVTSQIIYNDGSVPNWTPGVSGVGATFPTADFTSTTPPPFIDSECTLMTFNQYSTGRYVKYTAPVPVNRADYAVLTFRIWLFDDLTTIDGGIGRQPFVRLMGSGTNELLGSVYLNGWGLQRNLTNTWQLISIPLNVFASNPGVTDIAMFRIHCVEYLPNTPTPPNTQIAIDDVRLQTGYGPSASIPTIDVFENDAFESSTFKLNFIDGNNTTVDVTDDALNNKADVQYNVTSSFFGTANGRTTVEVTQESDFGVGGLLLPNTTYVVRGEVAITSTLQASSADGVEIIGLGRDTDGLNVTAVGITMLSITDSNVILKDLKFRGTGANSTVIRATNISAGAYNQGRLKTLAINDCQFRNCQNVMVIRGFDLVDINNCLFNYVEAPTSGLDFEDVSKLQITSCELIRWFNESTIPTPSGWATATMINLLPNNVVGFGAVNINGCVIHPQQTQIGINISALSTTGFGTISSNAFVPGPFTGAGTVFEPTLLGVPDYSATQALKYDVFANQGILNSTTGSVETMQGNSNDTAFAASSTPVIMQVGAGGTAPVLQAAVRMTLDTATGRVTYNGTKQIYVSMHLSLNYEKQGGGSGVEYQFYFYKNGSALPGGDVKVEGTTGDLGVLSMDYGVLLEQNDYIEIWVANNTNTNGMLTKDYQLVIRE